VAGAKRREWLHLDRKDLVDAARTTVATVASMLFAKLFRLPEAYWAGIATITMRDHHAVATLRDMSVANQIYEKRPDWSLVGSAERRGSGRPKCL